MIAIIIPYYKLEFFKATLESLKNQTDKRFKVYIGNDSSSEDPIPLLNKYKDAFDYNYNFFDSNLGGKSLVRQWQRCIALTETEEWIMILGDDDVLSNNIVELFYKNQEEIENKKINVVRFSTKVINAKDGVVSGKFDHPVLENGQDFLTRKFSKKTRSSLSEYMFRKEVVLQKKFKDLPLAWHSDDLAVLEFSAPNFIYSINDALLFIRVSNLSITGDSSSNDRKNWATFEFFKILFTEYNSLFTKKQKKILLNKLEIAFLNIPSFQNYKTVINYHFEQISFASAINFQLRLIRYRIVSILKKLKMFKIVYALYTKIVNK